MFYFFFCSFLLGYDKFDSYRIIWTFSLFLLVDVILFTLNKSRRAEKFLEFRLLGQISVGLNLSIANNGSDRAAFMGYQIGNMYQGGFIGLCIERVGSIPDPLTGLGTRFYTWFSSIYVVKITSMGLLWITHLCL